MKHFFCVLILLTVGMAACQQSTTLPIPTYEGQYNLQVSGEYTFDSFPVNQTDKGTLTVVKNADGTYTFTEKLSVKVRSYQVRVSGAKFEVPIQIDSFPVNGVTYSPAFKGTGEFKTNSVTITRTTSFTAGAVRVNISTETYGYR
ncbi:hypothetical protein [Spirosoma panaciterrae]|uniref:hypothetical protein n=1 Tax=Spirosoma panaciterrae TaxID=496058 RepID=UPI00059539AA|nr:hypothetical protein [Spirosoma panaciterrae]